MNQHRTVSDRNRNSSVCEQNFIDLDSLSIGKLRTTGGSKPSILVGSMNCPVGFSNSSNSRSSKSTNDDRKRLHKEAQTHRHSSGGSNKKGMKYGPVLCVNSRDPMSDINSTVDGGPVMPDGSIVVGNNPTNGLELEVGDFASDFTEANIYYFDSKLGDNYFSRSLRFVKTLLTPVVGFGSYMSNLFCPTYQDDDHAIPLQGIHISDQVLLDNHNVSLIKSAGYNAVRKAIVDRKLYAMIKKTYLGVKPQASTYGTILYKFSSYGDDVILRNTVEYALNIALFDTIRASMVCDQSYVLR